MKERGRILVRAAKGMTRDEYEDGIDGLIEDLLADDADDDDLGAPDDNDSAQAAGGIATCIGCGCDDRHACDGGCWWLEVDYAAGLGVCNQCVEHLDAWHDGDRTPHAPSAREEEAEAVRDLGRELRFEQPRPPGWRLDTCQHDWPYPQPDWGDACRWCGMSFARHVHTQCP